MSRKASPAYFKSRMSSFLNPLFLGSIATLFVLAFVVWQFVLQPNQSADNQNSGETGVDTANNPAIGAEGIENPDAAQNENSLAEEKTIDPGFLSQTTTGKEILKPISPGSAQQAQQSRASRLYDQIVGLDLFPDLLPNQGGVNDPIGNPSGVNVPPQYSQYARGYGQYRPGGGASATVQMGPTPLAAAVNQVMANSNYNRYVRQAPAQTQTYAAPVTANAPSLSYPSIAPSYGAPSPYGTVPTYGAPSPYGTAPTYGAPSPYGTAPIYGGASAYAPSYGVPTYGGASGYAPSYGAPTYGSQSFGYYGGGY